MSTLKLFNIYHSFLIKKWYLIADTTIEAEPFVLEPKENESQKYVTMNPQAICILVGK